MKCPKCGNELRQSKKDPAYGLCDECKKKFKLPESASIETETALSEDQPDENAKKYSNIPPKHVRHAREKEVKKNYSEMLSMNDDDKKRTPKKEQKSDIKPEAKPKDNADVRFKIPRLILGIVSILLSLLIAVESGAAGLINVLSGNEELSGTAGFILAICFFVAGIITICLKGQKFKAAFLTPAGFYIIGAFLAAANVGTYTDLVIWAILSGVFGSLLLLFMFLASETNKAAAILIPLIIVALISVITVFCSKTGTSVNSLFGKSEPEQTKTSTDNTSEKIDYKTDTFNLQYTTHALSKDYEGNQCLIVYFDFTNNGSEATNAGYETDITAFQNKTECETTSLESADQSVDNLYLDVQPGAAINVGKVFKLKDISDVTVEVSELLNLEGNTASQILTLN